MLEREIEKRLIDEVNKLKGLCLKLNSQSANGIPDRLVLLPGKRIYFIETKRPGEDLRSLQKYWKRKIIDFGFNYKKIDCMEDVYKFIEEVRCFID